MSNSSPPVGCAIAAILTGVVGLAMVAVPILAWIVEQYGWGYAVFVLGCMLLLVGLSAFFSLADGDKKE